MYICVSFISTYKQNVTIVKNEHVQRKDQRKSAIGVLMTGSPDKIRPCTLNLIFS